MSADLEPGTLLAGMYRVGALVGRGGMGAVYEAHRTTDGLRVVIKVLLSEVNAPDIVPRFEREAHAASRVSPSKSCRRSRSRSRIARTSFLAT